MLAITDHDTLGGVAAAIRAGGARGLRVVPGVELSVRAPAGSMHLLGYFGEPAPRPLVDRLEQMREARAARAREIVRLLAEAGAPVSFDDVAARAAGPIGRPHLADAVVAAGHARDRQDAFDRYLGDGGPAAVPHRGPAPEEAVRADRRVRRRGRPRPPGVAANGPVRPCRRSWAGSRRAGLRGIEVHRPDHTPERRDAYAGLARRHGLVAAGGSDFHRPDEGLRPGRHRDRRPCRLDAIDRLLAA